MHHIISLAFSLVAIADATGYPYMPIDLGPWGIDSSLVFANTVHLADANAKDSKEVKTTTRKLSSRSKDSKKVEHIKINLSDELDEAEEAFFHAVESVEDAVIHAIDDEVEILFPHREK